MTQKLQDLKDEFIRDVCSVTPLPKSEVKRRLEEIIKLEKMESYEEGKNH